MKLTDVEKISEKALATKLKWPNLKVARNRRDIDASLKRIRVRPDTCAIMRTEFPAKILGVDDENATIIFLYSVFPFGWGGSPAYFSPIGEGVALTHQEYISSDKIRGGSDFFSSQLFVEDAIFIEPDLGRKKEKVIARWEYVCRQILGSTSANMDKAELGGARNTAHISLGFEIGANASAIRLPVEEQIGDW